MPIKAQRFEMGSTLQGHRFIMLNKSCGGSDYRVIHGCIKLVVHFLVENPMTRCLMGRKVINW